MKVGRRSDVRSIKRLRATVLPFKAAASMTEKCRNSRFWRLIFEFNAKRMNNTDMHGEVALTQEENHRE